MSPTGFEHGYIALRFTQYFADGTRVAWLVDPKERTVLVYSAPDHAGVLREDESLDGGPLLPGFAFPIAGIFEIPDFDP